MSTIVRLKRTGPQHVDITVEVEGHTLGELEFHGHFRYWSNYRSAEHGDGYTIRNEEPIGVGAMLDGVRLYDTKIYWDDIQVLYIPPADFELRPLHPFKETP